MNLLLETKFALSPPEVVLSSDEEDEPEVAQKENTNVNEDDSFVDKTAEKIRKTLLFGGPSLSASIASQKRLFPSVPRELRGDNNNTHPVAGASPYFHRLMKLGLGEVENFQHPVNKRRSVVFKKRPLQDMSDAALTVVKKIKLDEGKYKQCFNTPLKPIENQLNRMNDEIDSE